MSDGPLVLCVVCGDPQRGYVYSTAGWICRSDWAKQTASYRIVTIEGVRFRINQQGTGREQRPEVLRTEGEEGGDARSC